MSKHDTLSELADALQGNLERGLLDTLYPKKYAGLNVRVDPALGPGEWRLVPAKPQQEIGKPATAYIPTTSPSREVEYLTARLKMAESANATLASRLARVDAEKQSMVAEIADLKASINAMSLASMVNAVSAVEVRPLIEELREHTLSRGTLAKCNAVLERLK